MACFKLPQELLLHVAEHADMDTVTAMARSCTELGLLLNANARSICKRKILTYLSVSPRLPPFPPVTLTNSGKVSVNDTTTWPMKSPWNVMLSSTPDIRRLLRPDTAEAVCESELRQRRARSMAQDGFLQADKDSRPDLTAPQLARFQKGLERALYLCDRIADIEGEVRADRSPVAVMESISYTMIQAAPASPASIMPIAFPEEAQLAMDIRARQCVYIQRLDATDLALLHQLIHLAGAGFKRWKAPKLAEEEAVWREWMAANQAAFNHDGAEVPTPLHVNGDAVQWAPWSPWDRVTAFEEAILRAGSMVLWAFARGTGGAESRLVDALVRQGAAEVYAWEHGRGLGLHHHLPEDEGQSEGEGSEEESEETTWDEEYEGDDVDMTPGEHLVVMPGLHMTVVRAFAARMAGVVEVKVVNPAEVAEGMSAVIDKFIDGV